MNLVSSVGWLEYYIYGEALGHEEGAQSIAAAFMLKVAIVRASPDLPWAPNKAPSYLTHVNHLPMPQSHLIHHFRGAPQCATRVAWIWITAIHPPSKHFAPSVGWISRAIQKRTVPVLTNIINSCIVTVVRHRTQPWKQLSSKQDSDKPRDEEHNSLPFRQFTLTVFYFSLNDQRYSLASSSY